MDIDPNLLTIILGLITNGLTSLIAQLGQKSGRLLIGQDFLDKWELEKTSLQPILQGAIRGVEESIEWSGPSNEEIVCLFLLSPEVEEIVRQIYSIKLLRKQGRNGLKLLRKVFLVSLSLFLASYPSSSNFEEEKLADPANSLFDTLIKGCDLALSSSIDKGILAAHEARSAFRYNMLLDEIDAIQKKLDLLTVSQQKLSIQGTLTFEKRYRQQVGNRHKDITPPYFDTARKIPINKIYVTPHIMSTSRTKREPELIEMEDFLKNIYRAVLLVHFHQRW